MGAQNRTVQVVIRTLVVVGVGMIMGDGVLTPAVSVVSAIEGLAVATPSFQKGDCARPQSPAALAMQTTLFEGCMLTNHSGCNSAALYTQAFIVVTTPNRRALCVAADSSQESHPYCMQVSLGFRI